MSDSLNREFESALIELYNRTIEETDYKPTKLLQMIRDIGAVSTAKSLIDRSMPSSGYTKLWELDRLDLTMEAFVLENPKWHQLFNETELNKAKQRLEEFGYIIK